MLACHAGGPGSIPGRCIVFFCLDYQPIQGGFLDEGFPAACKLAQYFVTVSLCVQIMLSSV